MMYDLTGQRFGRLVALERAPKSSWRCVCDCGSETTTKTANLRAGRIKSCGCLRNEKSSERAEKLIAAAAAKANSRPLKGFDIIQELRAERIRQNVTQAELAEKAGYSHSAISRVELGQTVPSLAMVLDFAQSLGRKLILRLDCEEARKG